MEIIPKKIKGILQLFRPFTLIAPIIGGTSAALMGASYGNFKNFSILELVYGVGTLAIVNMASNCLNAAYDADIDRINKPYRPIPLGFVSEDEARAFAIFLYILIIWRTAAFANFWFAFFVLLLVLLTILYSLPPIRLKKRLLISNFSIASGRGLFGFVGAWCIFSSPFSPIPWVVGLILFIYLSGTITTKDFTDIEGDKKYKIRTIPVVYGMRTAVTVSAVFFILPFPLIALTVMFDLLKPEVNYLLVLIGFAFYIIYLLKDFQFQQDVIFENTPVWKHMYLLLVALQIGFAVIYIL
ncbi:MAG: UbiA family prenyltransferase [Candidatus Thermoplasmatota archaeon]